MITPSNAGSSGFHHFSKTSCLPFIEFCAPPGASGALKTTSSLKGIDENVFDSSALNKFQQFPPAKFFYLRLSLAWQNFKRFEE